MPVASRRPIGSADRRTARVAPTASIDRKWSRKHGEPAAGLRRVSSDDRVAIEQEARSLSPVAMTGPIVCVLRTFFKDEDLPEDRAASLFERLAVARRDPQKVYEEPSWEALSAGGGGHRQPSANDAVPGRAAPTRQERRWCKGHRAAVSWREAIIRLVNTC
jgi:hypothetical protein